MKTKPLATGKHKEGKMPPWSDLSKALEGPDPRNKVMKKAERKRFLELIRGSVVRV